MCLHENGAVTTRDFFGNLTFVDAPYIHPNIKKRIGAGALLVRYKTATGEFTGLEAGRYMPEWLKREKGWTR